MLKLFKVTAYRFLKSGEKANFNLKTCKVITRDALVAESRFRLRCYVIIIIIIFFFFVNVANLIGRAEGLTR